MKRLKMPVLIIIVLCCGLSILGAIISPSKPSTPAAPEAARGAGVRDTAVPATATEPVKPTEAPKATETPAPTETPEPTVTAAPTPNTTEAEKDFIANLLVSEVNLAKAQDTFSALMTAAGRDSTKITDSPWVTAVTIQLLTIKEQCENIIKLPSPSKRFNPGVAKIREGAKMLIKGADLVPTAIDNRDAKKLGQASTLLTDGNAAMKEGMDTLTAVIKP